MKVGFRTDLLSLEPETEEERSALKAWSGRHEGHVFRQRESRLGASVFHSLGAEAEACREPINVTSRIPMPLKLISNFAHTPFELDGRTYASVEGFWQGLKFPDEADRRRLAGMHGSAPKDEGFYAPPHIDFVYDGTTIRVGTRDHWQLMERANRAKFQQNAASADALLSTGRRPLTHTMKQDSRTIPGAIMAEIWTRIRDELRAAGVKAQARTGGSLPPRAGRTEPDPASSEPEA